jgi:very-short-patch-repair endonuclease
MGIVISNHDLFVNMTEYFNKKELKARRRQLRSKMTYTEKLVWIYLRKYQMHVRFLRQYSIDNYIIDFYCPKLRLAIEIDGDIHDVVEQKLYDIERQHYLEGLGIKFIRVKNEEFSINPDKAFDKIETGIKACPVHNKCRKT